MKPGECEVEWQINIHGIHLWAFGIIFGKEKEALNTKFSSMDIHAKYKYTRNYQSDQTQHYMSTWGYNELEMQLLKLVTEQRFYLNW